MSERTTSGMLHDGQRLTLDEYLQTPETARPYELVYGVVREPAAPSWDHQQIVARLYGSLERHVRPRDLGNVGLSPLDVVLDADRHLVVQPDIVFVTAARTHLIRHRLWGAPDLVVEVLSAGTSVYDRGTKKDWYRQYGVRELWLVTPWESTIEVVSFSELQPPSTLFETSQIVRSAVLPQMRLRVASIFRGFLHLNG
jgi:Uma2 family endonuclease